MQCRPAFHQHQWIRARPNDTQHNSAEMAERILMDNAWHAGKILRESRWTTKETNRRIPSFYSLYIFSIENIMRQTRNIDINLLTEDSKHQRYLHSWAHSFWSVEVPLVTSSNSPFWVALLFLSLISQFFFQEKMTTIVSQVSFNKLFWN